MNKITIIIAGQIRANISALLTAYQTILPGAEIFISTWHSDADKVKDIDQSVHVLFNDDPGEVCDYGDITKNVLRNVYASYQGVQQSSNEYILRVRSDFYPRAVLKKDIERFIHIQDNDDEKFPRITNTLIANHYKYMVDTVGTTHESLHISDFSLLGKAKLVQEFYERCWSVLKNLKRGDLGVLPEFDPRKYHHIIAPEQLIQWCFLKSLINTDVFQIKPFDPQDLFWWHEFDTDYKNNVFEYFSLGSFIRPKRIDPTRSLHALIRFLFSKFGRDSIKPINMVQKMRFGDAPK